VIRVLLVDDQALIRAGFRALIDAEDDLTVVGEAANGADGVALAARYLPDVALVDIQMPVLDGIEATRRIVADPRLASVRVVILTNYGIDEHVYDGLRAGAAGFLVKDTEPVDLLQGLSNTIAVLQSKARHKAAAIAVHAPPGLPRVFGFSGELNQIWANLIDNALDALEEGGRIEVTASREGPKVAVRIIDNGPGIPDKVRDRIFDPFFTTKPQGLGTGLGLSVVDGIMKSHGGAVTVESRRGVGTVFKLYFPATENRGASVSAEKPAPAHAQGQRLLYVDDDAALVRLVVRKLTRLGYTVTGVEDPEQALELLKQDPAAFDAVVSDLSMPRMPGFELGRRILELRPSMPIVITSGFVRPEDEERARELGVRAFILKPQTIDELGNALNRIFSEG